MSLIVLLLLIFVQQRGLTQLEIFSFWVFMETQKKGKKSFLISPSDSPLTFQQTNETKERNCSFVGTRGISFKIR
jgi:hypothetical protein